MGDKYTEKLSVWLRQIKYPPKLLFFYYKIACLCYCPSIAAQHGNIVWGKTCAEFCTEKIWTLEDTHSIWFTETAEASYWLLINFGIHLKFLSWNEHWGFCHHLFHWKHVSKGFLHDRYSMLGKKKWTIA